MPGTGNIYAITLQTDPSGVQSLQWDLVTATGTNQFGVVQAPLIPQVDPTCNATGFGNCNMSGSNPVINVGENPNGLNGFGLFTVNIPPVGPATYANLGLASFDFVGGDTITFSGVSGFDAAGNPLTIDSSSSITVVPEPTTASLLVLWLGGLAFAGRRRR